MRKHSSASELHRIAESLTRSMKSIVVDPTVANHEGKDLVLQDGSPEYSEIAVRLGQRLGSGWFGSVYRIPRMSEEVARFLGVRGKQKVVAKVPHTLKLSATKSANPVSAIAHEREVRTYDLLIRNRSRLSRAMPMRPAWRGGKLPVVPILRELQTLQGRILIKPEMEGWTLREIHSRYGENLPSEMIDGLREIHALAQVVRKKIKLRVTRLGALPKIEGLSVDIRPTNLFWIYQKRVLERMGYRRPGFVLFELDQVPFNFPQYMEKSMPFPAYLEEFLTYLRMEGKR